MMEQQLVLLVLLSSLFVTGVDSQPYYDDSSLVYASSQEATIYTRVLCDLTVQCTGAAGTLWAFFGSSVPIGNEEYRYVNFSSYTTMNGGEVVVATLVLKPVLPDHKSLYDCVTDSVNTVAIEVDTDALEVIDLPDIDQSTYTNGDTISVPVSIETCLNNIWISAYKGERLVFNQHINNSRNKKPLVVDVPIEAGKASTGQYGVRVVADDYSTPLKFFNITGSPLDN